MIRIVIGCSLGHFPCFLCNFLSYTFNKQTNIISLSEVSAKCLIVTIIQSFSCISSALIRHTYSRLDNDQWCEIITINLKQDHVVKNSTGLKEAG